MPAALTHNSSTWPLGLWTVPQPGLGAAPSPSRGARSSAAAPASTRWPTCGHALDYERWNAQGAPGWSAECLPYWLVDVARAGRGPHRGSDGPSRSRGQERRLRPAQRGLPCRVGRQAGYPLTSDPNASSRRVGLDGHDRRLRDRERASTSRCYLHDLLPGAPGARPNLEVRTAADTRIVIERRRLERLSEPRAAGVEVVEGRSGPQTLRAGETIPCLARSRRSSS